MAHTFFWLSSTRLNCFSHVSQLYFNKITKGQKESWSSLLHAGVSTEWVQLHIFSGGPFFGITQRVSHHAFIDPPNLKQASDITIPVGDVGEDGHRKRDAVSG